MSGHRDIERLRRSINALTIGVVQAQRTRERELGPLSAGDIVQQVQVPVSGRVGRTPVQDDFEVQWEHPFLTRVAKGQSTMSFDNPTFATGIELKSADPVMLNVHLTDWVEDDSSFIVGAKVRLSAWSPNAPKLSRFSGIVHLTFFGYAAPTEEDPEG